jgi:hypothetical protein
LPANAGRYRVILLGASVASPTKDTRDNTDGIGDEIYAAAVAMVWDRRTNILQPPTVARTLEYGDVNAIRKAPNRIRAGNGGQGGGLVAGTTVPDNFIAGQLSTEPRSDQLPMLVWTGVLTDGIDALVVAPSLWEKDTANNGFLDYQRRWRSATSQNLVVYQPHLQLPGIAAAAQAIAPGQQLFSLAELILNVGDRPLGLSPQALLVPYLDRFVVITREKLGGLEPGNATHVSFNITEPIADPVLGVNYSLSLRIERTQ